jgi:hypothetical protein
LQGVDENLHTSNIDTATTISAIDTATTISSKTLHHLQPEAKQFCAFLRRLLLAQRYYQPPLKAAVPPAAASVVPGRLSKTMAQVRLS